MPSDQQPPLPLRQRLCAAVLVFALLWVGLAAVSPRLHAHVHHDGECETATCAAALFAQGVVPLHAAPTLFTSIPLLSRELPAAVAPIVHAAPARRLPPACGPPRG